MKNGFTLVELSIVLVIIGLLVGGILIGQSLISSAKTNRFVSFISQNDIAINSFKSRYNALPGDSTLFGGEGNKDNIVSDSYFPTSINGAGAAFDLEVADFWKELSLSGYKPENVIYSDDASTGIDIGVHIPAANIGSKNAAIMPFPRNTSISSTGTGVFNKHYNWYFIGDFSATTSAFWNHAGADSFTHAISPIDALSTDTKIDDGSAVHTGIVRPYAKEHPNGNCYSLDLRYLTNDEIACVISIAMSPPIF